MAKQLSDSTRAHCKRLLPLIGGVVTNIIVDDNDPSDVYCGFIIQMPNRKKIEILAVRDPEFNGAGHLSIEEVPDGR